MTTTGSGTIVFPKRACRFCHKAEIIPNFAQNLIVFSHFHQDHHSHIVSDERIGKGNIGVGIVLLAMRTETVGNDFAELGIALFIGDVEEECVVLAYLGGVVGLHLNFGKLDKY